MEKRKRTTYKHRCEFCGAEFSNHHPAARFCSKECRAAHNNHLKSLRKQGRPAGMSEVRWRIELRRRANKSYYNQFGDRVPVCRMKWA